jgi:hypothetical protein
MVAGWIAAGAAAIANAAIVVASWIAMAVQAAISAAAMAVAWLIAMGPAILIIAAVIAAIALLIANWDNREGCRARGVGCDLERHQGGVGMDLVELAATARDPDRPDRTRSLSHCKELGYHQIRLWCGDGVHS